MSKINIVIFDVETGGLKAKEHAITQIGLQTVQLDTWSETNRWESYVKPYGDFQVTDGGLNASMVTKKDLLTAPPAKEVFNVLIEYFKASKPSPRRYPILAGHNVSFDIAFLKQFFSFHGKELHNYVAHNNGEIIRWDTLELAKKTWGDNKDDDEGLRLGACCKRAKIELIDAHGAMADVLATSKLLYFFKQLLSNAEGNTAGKDTKIGEKQKLRHNSEQPFQF